MIASSTSRAKAGFNIPRAIPKGSSTMKPKKKQMQRNNKTKKTKLVYKRVPHDAENFYGFFFSFILCVEEEFCHQHQRRTTSARSAF